MSTTQRLSSLLVATIFIVLLALMATFGVRSADAAHQVEPLGSCPPKFDPGLVDTHFVLAHTGNFDPNREPPPSMDGNGDGWTCLDFVAVKGYPQGQRVVYVDNRLPL